MMDEHRKRLFRSCLTILRELEAADTMTIDKRGFTYGEVGVSLMHLKLRATLEELGNEEEHCTRWICDRCRCCACDECFKSGQCRSCKCMGRHEEVYR